MENKDKKYSCDNCLFYTNYASEWNKHTKSMKHQRGGKPKEKINDLYECENCDYKGLTHWNVKMHQISVHSIKEERENEKYYCKDCDKVFFCEKYLKKHIEGIVHKNKVIANESLN